MTDRIITAHQGRSTWQGPRSEAPDWALRQVDGASGVRINGEAATRAAGGRVGDFCGNDGLQAGRGLGGPRSAAIEGAQ